MPFLESWEKVSFIVFNEARIIGPEFYKDFRGTDKFSKILLDYYLVISQIISISSA